MSLTVRENPRDSRWDKIHVTHSERKSTWPNSERQCTWLTVKQRCTWLTACVFRSVTQVSGPAPGSVMQKGSRTVIYKARDSGGLSDYCHFTVTVSGETVSVTILPLHCQSVRWDSHYAVTSQSVSGETVSVTILSSSQSQCQIRLSQSLCCHFTVTVSGETVSVTILLLHSHSVR